MWGLVIFAVAAYILYPILMEMIYHNRGGLNWPKQGNIIISGILFILLWRLTSFYDIPFYLRILYSLGGVGLLYLLITTSFNVRYSILLIFLSVFLVIIGFLSLGGLPLFNEDMRLAAKLSLLREITLPLFLIGATSLSLHFRDQSSIWKHIIPFCLFTFGCFMFALNGKRLDVLVIAMVYVLFLVRTYHTRRILPVLSSLIGIAMVFAYIVPSQILIFIRQHFNFQVLNHIIYYVETPITGITHGIISFGLKREFIGANLIYGETENWVLTATWIGPPYLDFGLFGILLLMGGLAILLHQLQRYANLPGIDNKFEVLYIVVLGRILVLYEEGADLPIFIFLIAITYGFTMKTNQSNINRTSSDWYRIPKNKMNRQLLRFILFILLGLSLITWAFDAEFRQSQTIYQKEFIANQSEVIFNVALTTRYYHIELISNKIAAFLHGTLNITQNDALVSEFEVDGVFWLAEKDVVHIGWFKPHEPEQYTFTLSGNYGSEDMIIIRLKEAPLASVIPTYRILQLSYGIIFFGGIISIYPYYLKKSKE